MIIRDRQAYKHRIDKIMEEMMGAELERVRQELLESMSDEGLTLLDYAERALAFWEKCLGVDRIFVCDMRDGSVIAGWNKGKNIIKLGDWDPHYVPLEDDTTLQRALESDELVASPVEGEGADLAFSVRFPNGGVWLVVFDQTDSARYFSHLDMAHIRLARDLLILKSRLG